MKIVILAIAGVLFGVILITLTIAILFGCTEVVEGDDPFFQNFTGKELDNWTETDSSVVNALYGYDPKVPNIIKFEADDGDVFTILDVDTNVILIKRCPYCNSLPIKHINDPVIGPLRFDRFSLNVDYYRLRCEMCGGIATTWGSDFKSVMLHWNRKVEIFRKR